MLLPVLLMAIIIQGCYSPEKDIAKGTSGFQRYASHAERSGIEYARGFNIENYTGDKILHVMDPWQGSSGIHLEYVLSSNPDLVPDSIRQLPLIITPVTRVICMSTTHVAMIDALGKTGTIVGVSGPDYISSPPLRTRINNNETMDVGADQSLNYERIVSLKPDVLISYGVTGDISGMVKRLGDLGIPVVLNADYLENEPLGKTEWLKFMATFFEMESEADSIFEGIAFEYEKYRDLAEQSVTEHSPGQSHSPASSQMVNPLLRPTVITGLPWKDAWYIPGGKSFAAAFIRDAGGDFLWKDMDSHEAAPVNLESVFMRAIDADFWINCGSALKLDDIRETESRLVKLGPFQKSSVYNKTARLNSTGGNDFWEKGVMEPHLILADLISIFHPNVLQGHELVYYEQLY